MTHTSHAVKKTSPRYNLRSTINEFCKSRSVLKLFVENLPLFAKVVFFQVLPTEGLNILFPLSCRCFACQAYCLTFVVCGLSVFTRVPRKKSKCLNRSLLFDPFSVNGRRISKTYKIVHFFV